MPAHPRDINNSQSNSASFEFTLHTDLLAQLLNPASSDKWSAFASVPQKTMFPLGRTAVSHSGGHWSLGVVQRGRSNPETHGDDRYAMKLRNPSATAANRWLRLSLHRLALVASPDGQQAVHGFCGSDATFGDGLTTRPDSTDADRRLHLKFGRHRQLMFFRPVMMTRGHR